MGLAILWMIFIFYMSHQPANVSSQQSGSVIELIKSLPILGEIMSFMMKIEIGEFIIRKSAHMFLYFMLAILIFMSIYENRNYIKKDSIKAFVLTVIYACTDELHQLFIEGRSGEIRDVLVDSIGASIGIMVIYFILKRKQEKVIE